MTTAPTAPLQVKRGRLAVLAVPAALYVLLHYVVVGWLTFDLIGRADLLSTRLFTLGGTDVRLWWLVSALVMMLCLAAHVFFAVDRDTLAEPAAVAVHLPAVFGAWTLVWGDFTIGHDVGALLGGVIANLLWSVLFAVLVLASGLVIGVVIREFAKVMELAEEINRTTATSS